MRRLLEISMVIMLTGAGVLPSAALAQTGKHVSIGGSAGTNVFKDDRFSNGQAWSFLYRLRGHESNGLSLGPAVTLSYAVADYRPDVGGSELKIGSVQTIPIMAGGGPRLRFGRWFTSVAVTAGMAVNHFRVNDQARDAYFARTGDELQDVSTNSAVAYKPSVSVWYDLTSRLGLYGGVSYFYCRPNASITAGGVTTHERWNMDYTGYNVGAVLGVF